MPSSVLGEPRLALNWLTLSLVTSTTPVTTFSGSDGRPSRLIGPLAQHLLIGVLKHRDEADFQVLTGLLGIARQDLDLEQQKCPTGKRHEIDRWKLSRRPSGKGYDQTLTDEAAGKQGPGGSGIESRTTATSISFPSSASICSATVMTRKIAVHHSGANVADPAAPATSSVMRSRPVYPYPALPKYDGTNNPNDAASFVKGDALYTAATMPWAGEDFFQPYKPTAE